MGLSNDYAELGSVFNSFSLMFSEAFLLMLLRSEEEGGGRANGNGGGGLDGATTTETDTKADKYKSNDNNDELNFIFDKIGQCFDRSYIAINLLIGDLETQFRNHWAKQYSILKSCII